MPTPTPYRRHTAAFTILELLMAMTIASIMVFIAYVVLAQMQSGIRTSVQRAQISLAGQALDTRFRLDAKAMLGPNSTLGSTAGAIVIVPALREGYVPIPTHGGQMSSSKVRLRCDQLAFVTDVSQGSWVTAGTASGKKWSSLMPADLHASAPVQSNQGLVWYGAVRNSSLLPGDGTSKDPYYWAQNWQFGRQMNLLTGGAVDLTQLGVTAGNDTVAGTVAGLADAACGTRSLPGGSTVRGPGWTTGDYLKYLAVDPTASTNVPAGAPASSFANDTNIPVDNLNIDLNAYRQDPTGNLAKGLQLADVDQANLRLFDHCSEVIIQWAGDLDKDGNIDTYPAGHPLAGSIVWYPEEIHDKGSWYNGRTSAMNPASAALYNTGIKPNRWSSNYPTGFTGPAAARFGGHGTQNATWYTGFELDYGEQDNRGGQTTAPTRNLPAPYVFRFDDDQYRKVRFGFRQDGSAWKNACDGCPVPANLSGGLHYFPYPPTANGYMDNPDPAVLYVNRNPPAGPYPAAALGTTNFADAMGSYGYPAGGAAWTWGMIQTNAFGATTANAFRLSPNATYPNGRLITLQEQRAVACGKKPNGSYMMVYIVVGANSSTGTEPVFDPSVVYRSQAMPGFAQGQQIVFQPSVEAGFGAGAMSGNQVTATGWFSLKLGAAAAGTEPQVNVLSYNYMAASFGPGNNYIANYADIYAEWLQAINSTALQGSRADWRNPQSDWPKLIRIRVRLHDAQGQITSYADDFLVNGRDDDGDGVVDNPEEGAMAGVWYEFVLAVPYPRDPAPRTLAP